MVLSEIKEMSKLSKEEWREFTKTVWQIANVSSKEHPAVYPKEIPYRLIKMFSFVNETVFDPFAGVGTTLLVARDLQRNSVGLELNPEYITIANRELAQQTLSVNRSTTHEIYERDSTDLSIFENDSFDLIVTSPPYWDKVQYSNNKNDLANINDYNEFHKAIKNVFSECYRVLKPGRRMCVITANVHKDTEYGLQRFPLSVDYTNSGRDVGFLLVSEIIWVKYGTGGKWGSFGHQKPIFGSYPYPPNFLFKDLHEYILVFRKQPNKTKTPKKGQLSRDQKKAIYKEKKKKNPKIRDR